MKSLYLIILITMVSLLPARPAEAITAESLFSVEEIAAVLQGKIITRAYLKEAPPINIKSRDDLTLPRLKYMGDFSNYEMVADEKAFIPYKLTDANRLAFYNLLASHSRLAGMMYYSRADKKLAPFVIDSYSVDAMERDRKTADPAYASIEKRQVSYFKVRDNRFGEIIFRCNLYSVGEAFIVKSTSVVPLSKYGMLVSAPGEYRIINYFIYDQNAGGFYTYALHVLRIHSGVLLKSRMLSPWSFANRLRAGTVHMAQLLGVDLTDQIIVTEDQ